MQMQSLMSIVYFYMRVSCLNTDAISHLDGICLLKILLEKLHISPCLAHACRAWHDTSVQTLARARLAGHVPFINPVQWIEIFRGVELSEDLAS